MIAPRAGAVSSSSEAAVIAAAKRGDGEARQVLFERHFEMAERLALRFTGRRSEAEDIVQDAFVEALSALRNLQNHEAFNKWFIRIVVNTTRRFLRRKILRRRLGLLDYVPLDVAELAARARAPEDEIYLRRVYETLDTLPPHQRLVIVMRHLEGRQIDEIADLVARSRATVKRWLAAGERLVRHRMKAPAGLARLGAE